MELTDTCPCGAQFAIKTNESIDARNRHQDWLAAHEVCRYSPHMDGTFPPLDEDANP